jgi:hypothetical protein
MQSFSQVVTGIQKLGAYELLFLLFPFMAWMTTILLCFPSLALVNKALKKNPHKFVSNFLLSIVYIFANVFLSLLILNIFLIILFKPTEPYHFGSFIFLSMFILPLTAPLLLGIGVYLNIKHWFKLKKLK